jgi:hypothetical protein
MESGDHQMNPFHLPETLTFHFRDVDIHRDWLNRGYGLLKNPVKVASTLLAYRINIKHKNTIHIVTPVNVNVLSAASGFLQFGMGIYKSMWVMTSHQTNRKTV